MKEPNNSEGEAERRTVAEEKLWGYIIEDIERMRKHPVTRSIMARFLSLHKQISQFQQVVRAMGSTVDPLKTAAPSFTTDQTNILIRTYNSIIQDIRSHLKMRDWYVQGFDPIEELSEPTVNDAAGTLFMMATNIAQIMSYMLRWVD